MKIIKRGAIFFAVAMVVFTQRVNAQDSVQIKPSTLIFHVFYNDFPTAQLIRTTSLNNALNSGQWKRLADMQMGLGLSYMKGLNRRLDALGTMDASYADYLFKDGTSNGSSKFLLDAGLGLNVRLLNGNPIFNPFLSGGFGASLYSGKTGFYVPAGVGLQANLFNQAFVLLNLQYRKGINGLVNDHFHYNIGIGFSLSHKKTHSALPVPAVVKPADTVAIKKPEPTVQKNIMVKVSDEQTGLPLPGVAVLLRSADTLVRLETDSTGNVNFMNITASTYNVSGTLNGISTNTSQITVSNFDITGQQLNISLKHNDPRFTLAGNVVNDGSGKPEGGVAINLQNISKNIDNSIQNRENDGGFNMQLDAGCDFTVSGKKAGYLSNIEKLSTRGLNRSTTLYVKLKLAIQQTQANKAIMLNNIYYDTGSAAIKPEASTDLEKLSLFLKDNPAIRIEIDSHTDSRGSRALNNRLSQARAAAVVAYLVKQGIDRSRLLAKGFGASQPVNGCLMGIKCTDEQYAQNRRTEFKVLK
jgi:outer membrane protein OmpA-like peptidoglycan-associated protein